MNVSKTKIKKSIKDYYSLEKTKRLFNTDELSEGLNQSLEIIKKHYDVNFKENSNKSFPDVKPGFLINNLPNKPPIKGENLKDIISDTEKFIIPGIRNWQNPNFFSYFPAQVSHPVIIANLLADSFQGIGFTWHSSPSCTELENVVVDWLADIFNLPEKFKINSKGGGIVSSTTGDSIFLAVNMAKYKIIKNLNLNKEDEKKLVGYYTDHCHIQVFKALAIKEVANIKSIPIEFNETEQNFQINKEKFKEIIEKDISIGLIPFFVGATIGTTSSGAFDDIEFISSITQKNNIFLMIDCAWGGNYFVLKDLPEIKKVLNCLNSVNSIVINPTKAFACGMNSSAFYVDDKEYLTASLFGRGSELDPNPTYLKNEFSNEKNVTDYKDWQIGLGRKFNSLKIYFNLRYFGVEGYINLLSNSILMAEYFEEIILKDKRFEMFCDRSLSLVCIRLIRLNGEIIIDNNINEANNQLVDLINNTNEIFICGSKLQGKYFLRFAFYLLHDINEYYVYVDNLYRVLSDCVDLIKL